MIDQLIGALVGYFVCKLLGGGGGLLSNILPVVTKGTKPAGIPSDTKPILTHTTAPFPVSRPTGLPPFPSGWKPATVTPSIVQRAWALLPVMALNSTKLEAGPGGSWLTYYKHRMASGKTGVSVYEPKVRTVAA